MEGVMDKPDGYEFRGKINRRLSLIFGFLFFVVLLVGGFSLYLARSISLSGEQVGRESERIDLVDQIHSTIHHLISDLQRARLEEATISDSARIAYLQQLDTLLQRYEREGGGDREVTGGIRQMIGDLASLSEKMARQIQPALGPQELEALANVEQGIRALAHRLSAAHRGKMGELVRESRWKMRLILGFYAAFVVVGGLLILGSSFFFSWTIARPLRWLADAASEIAEGNLHKEVPVTSKDEIGQLSHAFNIMTDRLKQHEERLKGLATLEERERIAQELHDSLAQDLGLLHLKIIEAEQNLDPKGSLPARKTLQEMRKITGDAYENVRQAIFGLRTMVSKGLGFIPTLTEYLHDFSELRKIPVDFKIEGDEVFRFSPYVEIQLIHIIHEALTNVFKHAPGARSEVRFEREGEFAKVIIEDNGEGFLMKEAARNGLHFGIRTMGERSKAAGGRLTIDTAPGRGTRVIVHLPSEKRFYDDHARALGR